MDGIIPEDLNLDNMQIHELRELLEHVNDVYSGHLQKEPGDEDSEAYEEWEESLEDLDDLIDDIMDHLENQES